VPTIVPSQWRRRIGHDGRHRGATTTCYSSTTPGQRRVPRPGHAVDSVRGVRGTRAMRRRSAICPQRSVSRSQQFAAPAHRVAFRRTRALRSTGVPGRGTRRCPWRRRRDSSRPSHPRCRPSCDRRQPLRGHDRGHMVARSVREQLSYARPCARATGARGRRPQAACVPGLWSIRCAECASGRFDSVISHSTTFLFRRPRVTFALMGLFFLMFAVTSVNLFVPLKLNLDLFLEYGLMVIADGALQQLADWSARPTSAWCSSAVPVCERVLVLRLTAKRSAPAGEAPLTPTRGFGGERDSLRCRSATAGGEAWTSRRQADVTTLLFHDIEGSSRCGRRSERSPSRLPGMTRWPGDRRGAPREPW